MRNYKITNTLQAQNIVYRLKIIRNYKITKLQDFWELRRKKRVLGEIEMETKLKMKIIPRSTSEALEFFRQVRFLPDFYPDRAACARCGEK